MTDDDVEMVTIRAVEDVGESVGYDGRDYHLEQGDVVDLPEVNAGPLLDRGVAERAKRKAGIWMCECLVRRGVGSCHPRLTAAGQRSTVRNSWPW